MGLMYAIVRHESRFFPDAVSPVGAMGLFQVMPGVFEDLDGLYFGSRLLGGSIATARDFLFDPGRNAAFWACWRSTHENPIAERTELAKSLMQHQAGAGNLRRWQRSSYGQNAQADRDVEFMVEVARFSESRNFVSLALNDTAIAEASGIAADVAGGRDSGDPCRTLDNLLNTGR